MELDFFRSITCTSGGRFSYVCVSQSHSLLFLWFFPTWMVWFAPSLPLLPLLISFEARVPRFFLRLACIFFHNFRVIGFTYYEIALRVIFPTLYSLSIICSSPRQIVSTFRWYLYELLLICVLFVYPFLFTGAGFTIYFDSLFPRDFTQRVTIIYRDIT